MRKFIDPWVKKFIDPWVTLRVLQRSIVWFLCHIPTDFELGDALGCIKSAATF